jgi:hypothetical protein
VFTRLRSLYYLSAVVLGTVGPLAVGSPSNAASMNSAASRPSAATPYCVVVIARHSVGAERCVGTRARAASLVPDTSTVISIDYVNSGFQGASLTWTESGTIHCSGFPNYQASSMPGGWNEGAALLR